MSQYLIEVGFKNGQTYSRYVDISTKDYIEKIFFEMWGESSTKYFACISKSTEEKYSVLGFRVDDVIWLSIKEIKNG